MPKYTFTIKEVEAENEIIAEEYIRDSLDFYLGFADIEETE